MPSRAFCSDESQGYPVILLAKHFGVFPFNHGKVGGIMACGRHGPHAHHGQDLVIVHASHVGYDPETWRFGSFRRAQTEDSICSSSCGKIAGVLKTFLDEYQFARDHILVDMRKDHCRVTIDNQYLSQSTAQRLVLNLDKMVEHHHDDEIIPVSIQSTSRTFIGTEHFRQHMSWFITENEGPQKIGDALLPEYFCFRQKELDEQEETVQLEKNLLGVMPWIVTSAEPMLTAAQANTQAEFDRAFRSISQDQAYNNKNLLYIAGLHVDISPAEGQQFVLTKFIPWAAFIQLKSGERIILEQEALYQKLKLSSTDNPDQLNFDEAINTMEDASPIHLHLPY